MTTETNIRWAGAKTKNSPPAISTSPTPIADIAPMPTFSISGSGASGRAISSRPPATAHSPAQNGRLRRQHRSARRTPGAGRIRSSQLPVSLASSARKPRTKVSTGPPGG
ncbi:hypothetical protein O1L55_26720 [Streptomyces albulus]|nr:hypothetical protein [Streptomyces noursei]